MSKIIYEVEVYHDGSTYWWLRSDHYRKQHREDGPAVEWPDGSKFWYLDGQRHREDGPAIKYADGSKFWYLDGKRLYEADFNARMMPPTCEGKVVTIDGMQYKLNKF